MFSCDNITHSGKQRMPSSMLNIFYTPLALNLVHRFIVCDIFSLHHVKDDQKYKLMGKNSVTALSFSIQ